MTDEAMKAMARRIVADTIYYKPGRDFDDARAKVLNGDWDTFDHVRAALAAIIETTELAAKYAEHRVGFGLTNLAADYRAAAHFQKDHPHA